MSKFIDLTGQPFGKLTAIEYLGNGPNGALWLCQCECGKKHPVVGRYLRNGRSKSCGCGTRIAQSRAMSKGSSAIVQNRLSAGLTMGQLARKANVDRTTVLRLENETAKQPFFRVRAGMRKAIRDDAPIHVITDEKVRDDLRYTATERCGYCHECITRHRSKIEYSKRHNKSGLIFCDASHANKFHKDGPLPIPTAPPQVLMDAPKPPKERRAPHADMIGIRKAQEAAKRYSGGAPHEESR